MLILFCPMRIPGGRLIALHIQWTLLSAVHLDNIPSISTALMMPLFLDIGAGKRIDDVALEWEGSEATCLPAGRSCGLSSLSGCTVVRPCSSN
jgi:hypothetical protein